MSPKPYVRTVLRYSWWLAQGRYLRYMAREVTSLFIGAYTAVLIIGLARLAEGRAGWEAYLEALQSPVGVAFHVVAFLFALYHTATWFNVTPKAMPLEVAGRRLPGAVIVGAHYAGWAVVSAALLMVAGG
jgi:fumarate reductase subunit C